MSTDFLTDTPARHAPQSQTSWTTHDLVDPISDSWRWLIDALGAGSLTTEMIPAPWRDIFGPLFAGNEQNLTVVAQLGQSICGRIATRTGHSKYINGQPGLTHLHRLRSLCDAVMVGVGTVVADDPLLNVRHVPGADPHRVIIDPHGRTPRSSRLLAEGVRRIILTSPEARLDMPHDVEIIRLPYVNGSIAPAAIRTTLRELGMTRVLLEGGAETISRFLSAHALDRLHVIVAPVILGDGRAGLVLPPIETVDQALRPPTRTHILEGEVLFDCSFTPNCAEMNASNFG